MTRSRGNRVGGNGKGVAPMMGNVSRQDLDMLFDDPSTQGIKAPSRAAAPTGEAAKLFRDDEVNALYNDDEVASLFEESTSDSVPNALVPSRLKPCKRVIISPTSRKALRPASRPERARRWPALKPALSARPAPASAPRISDPEDAPTIPTVPTLPRLPRIIQSKPLAIPQPKPAPSVEPTVEPEELDTRPEMPLVPIPTPQGVAAHAQPAANTPEQSAGYSRPDPVQLADLLEPEPEMLLEPEPIPQAKRQPAPQPPKQPEPRPQQQARPEPMPRPVAQPEPTPQAQPAVQPLLQPVVKQTPRPAFVEPDPTLRVMVRPPQRTLSRVQAAGMFLAGAAVSSLLLLGLAPWSPEQSSAPAPARKVVTTTPDTAMRPLTTPLADPPTKAPAALVAAAPAPDAASLAKETAATELPVPGAIPLPEPPVTNANLAGVKVAQTILPCLSHRERFYQKVGVKLSSYSSVRNGLIDRKWGASEKSLACVKKALRNLRLPHLPAGRYVEWHLAMQGGTPRAWVTYPRELVVRTK